MPSTTAPTGVSAVTRMRHSFRGPVPPERRRTAGRRDARCRRHDRDDAGRRERTVGTRFEEPRVAIRIDAEVEQAVVTAAQRVMAAAGGLPHPLGDRIVFAYHPCSLGVLGHQEQLAVVATGELVALRRAPAWSHCRPHTPRAADIPFHHREQRCRTALLAPVRRRTRQARCRRGTARRAPPRRTPRRRGPVTRRPSCPRRPA